MKCKASAKAGFVLTELLLAVGVLGLGMVVFYQSLAGARRLSRRGHDRLIAQWALQEAAARTEARGDFGDPPPVSDLLNPEWGAGRVVFAGRPVWALHLRWAQGRHTDDLELPAVPWP